MLVGACSASGGTSPTPAGATSTSSGDASSSGDPTTSGGPQGSSGTSGASGSVPEGGSDLDDEFDGAVIQTSWTAVNAGQTDNSVNGGVLRMKPNKNCVWFNADEGPGLVKLVTGNFKVTANVRARRASNPSQPAPGTFQFAGLIARDPAGSRSPENYVFTVMGERGGWLTNETKNTINGASKVHGPNEGRTNSDAELRICRIDQVFRMYNRPPQGGAWKLESTYNRAADMVPLPQTLQVGPIAYTYTNSPDLVGEFEYVRYRVVSSLADCTTD